MVTQIAYNPNSESIVAEVKFLTREEWTEELKVLLSDLSDPETSNDRAKSSLGREAAAAWAKVRFL